MAYQLHGLPRRIASDKVLHNQAFNIAENPKYDGYQLELASLIYKFFDKMYAGVNTSSDPKVNPLVVLLKVTPRQTSILWI